METPNPAKSDFYSPRWFPSVSKTHLTETQGFVINIYRWRTDICNNNHNHIILRSPDILVYSKILYFKCSKRLHKINYIQTPFVQAFMCFLEKLKSAQIKIY